MKAKLRRKAIVDQASPFSLPADIAIKALREHRFPVLADRMKFVLEIAAMNISLKYGGPFGAAVFEIDTGRLISIGINLVIWSNSSIAHAEIVAINNAEQAVGFNYIQSLSSKIKYELVTSSEPCIMCYGAIHWSNIQRIVCGSRSEDVREIGFDEGEKNPRWIAELYRRGVQVVQDVCRPSAIKVLQLYKEQDGMLYNPQ